MLLNCTQAVLTRLASVAEGRGRGRKVFTKVTAKVWLTRQTGLQYLEVHEAACEPRHPKAATVNHRLWKLAVDKSRCWKVAFDEARPAKIAPLKDTVGEMTLSKCHLLETHICKGAVLEADSGQPAFVEALVYKKRIVN